MYYTESFDKCSNVKTPSSDVSLVPSEHSSINLGLLTFLDQVQLDPEVIFPDNIKHQFIPLLSDFDDVFSPSFKVAKVNMGPV